jgi:replicative DNA helicase
MVDVANLYSPHAEESLVGAALISPEILDTVNVNPEDFYIHKMRYIWQALIDLRYKGVGIDFVTVGNELYTSGKLEEIGGPAYMVGLINDTPSSLGADDYAIIVKDNANRRRALQTANDLARAAMDTETALDVSIGKVMTDLSSTSCTGQRAEHWGKYLTMACDRAEERARNPKGVWGIRTGFDDYDYISGGLQLSELTLLTGEPGVGKSMWTQQLMVNMAHSEPGAVYSLEMLGEYVALRAITASAKIETRKIKSGTAGDEVWPSFLHAVEELDALPIYMSDSESWTTVTLRADLARLKREQGIKWFIVDYSYLLQDGDGKLDEIERTQLVIKNLKGICKSLNLAGVAIHSLTKAYMGTAITQAALRGSGQNIYDADVIIGLTIPDQMYQSIIRVSVLKGREMDQKGSFELERLNGIPFYQPVERRVVDLNGDHYNAQRP